MSSKSCVFCYTDVSNDTYVPAVESAKLFKTCASYLHSSIISNLPVKNITPSTKNKFKLCHKCFESASDLAKFSKQLTKLQKEISDLSTVFSMGVFHRRNYEIKNTTFVKNNHTTIELDVSDLPADLFSACLHPVEIQQPPSNENHDFQHCNNYQLQTDSENTFEVNQIEEIKIESDSESDVNNDQFLEFTAETQNVETSGNMNQYYEDSGVISNSSIEINDIRSVHHSIGHCRVEPIFDQCVSVGNKIPISELVKSVQLPQIVLDGIQADARKNVVNQNGQPVNFRSSVSSSFNSNPIFEPQRSTERYVPIFTQGNIHPEPVSNVQNSFKKNILKIGAGMKKHKNEPAGECDICGKVIARKSLLKAHRRIHTGEKPYKCKYCDKKFSEFGNRTKHEKCHERKSAKLSDDLRFWMRHTGGSGSKN